MIIHFNIRKQIVLFLSIFTAISLNSQVFAGNSYVSQRSNKEFFPLVVKGKTAPLCVSSQDFAGVLRVTKHLQTDIANVSGIEPEIINDKTIGKIADGIDDIVDG
jgi:hypothetical protein